LKEMYAAVRVRGSVKVIPNIKKTLQLLMLDRVNHLVLVKDDQKGMLDKVQAYITFGEIDEETLSKVLEKRGRLAGNKKLDKEFLKEKKFKDFKEIAKAILEGKTSPREISIKPVFRLSPPKKGYERAGIKKGYSIGGALGYRAADINKLLGKMI